MYHQTQRQTHGHHPGSRLHLFGILLFALPIALGKLTQSFRVSPFAEELCSDAMRREISERLRVKRETLTGAEVHIGILCLYLFSARVVVFRECLRISEERRETIVAVWPFLKGFAHVTQRSCVWWQLAQSCSR